MNLDSRTDREGWDGGRWMMGGRDEWRRRRRDGGRVFGRIL
jgi:hypothetical protein